jgi:hypothetical protein
VGSATPWLALFRRADAPATASVASAAAVSLSDVGMHENLVVSQRNAAAEDGADAARGRALSLREVGEQAARVVLTLKRTVMSSILSDDLAHEARFLVLLKQRRVAAMLTGHSWPDHTDDTQRLLTFRAAPSPADAYWPNMLRRGRTYGRLRRLAGVGLTIALYFFWTVPVAFAMSLANLQDLSQTRHFGFLKGLLDNFGPTLVSQVQVQLSSIVLALCRYLTLSSGLFQQLVRLEGIHCHTKIVAATASRMFLFQLVFVLLLSLISTTLLDTIRTIFDTPNLLPYTLARAVPSQSIFFMNYLAFALLFCGLFDELQLFALLEYCLRAACTSACCAFAGLMSSAAAAARQHAGRGLGDARTPLRDDAPTAPPASNRSNRSNRALVADAFVPPELPETARDGGRTAGPLDSIGSVEHLPYSDVSTCLTPPRSAADGGGAGAPGGAGGGASDERADRFASLRCRPYGGHQFLLDLYAHVVLLCSILHAFMIVAPLATLVAWLYFIPAYPLYARTLLCVVERPKVDTRGGLWEVAVAYQTIGLLVAQLILFGICLLKEAPEASTLVFISFSYTAVRAAQMRRLAKSSGGVPLRRCAQLDALGAVASSLREYEEAADAAQGSSLSALFDDGAIANALVVADLAQPTATPRQSPVDADVEVAATYTHGGVADAAAPHGR